MRKKKKLAERRKSFAFLVDGDTEVWYLRMLQRNESALHVKILPEIPQKKKLSDQYEKVCILAEEHTKVFWIIDVDALIAESKKTKKGTTSIQKLKHYIAELEKYSNVVTILNNPCLEFWFLLHFEQTTRFYSSCAEAEKRLKLYLRDYEKKRKYFTKQNQDIYLKLKPTLHTAILNAKLISKRDLQYITERALCEMYLFFESMEISVIL